MSRWKKDDAIADSLYIREWSKTEVGQAYIERHKGYAKEWRKNNKDKFHTAQKQA